MWIEATKNGKYKACERYTDPLTGKLKKVSVTIEKDNRQTRKAAQEELEEKIERAVAEALKTDQDVTLRELADLYIRHQKKNVRPQTFVRDETLINIVTRLLGEDVMVDKLTARFISSRLDSSEKDNVTLNSYLSQIKRMLNWGFREDYILDIAFLKKLQPYPDKDRKARIEDKFLSSDELKMLLEGMTVIRWKLLTHFLALSGLRIGEAMALTGSDITDFIKVEKTVDVNSYVVSENAKTDAGNRDVFVQPELAEVVKEIRQYIRMDQMKRGYRTNLFIPGPDGEYLKYQAYNKYLKETSGKLLNHPITPHALRHTHVSLLAENGVPLDAISRRVGHEDSSVTKQIYLHITEKQKEKDNAAISKVKLI